MFRRCSSSTAVLSNPRVAWRCGRLSLCARFTPSIASFMPSRPGNPRLLISYLRYTLSTPSGCVTVIGVSASPTGREIFSNLTAPRGLPPREPPATISTKCLQKEKLRSDLDSREVRFIYRVTRYAVTRDEVRGNCNVRTKVQENGIFAGLIRTNACR